MSSEHPSEQAKKSFSAISYPPTVKSIAPNFRTSACRVHFFIAGQCLAAPRITTGMFKLSYFSLNSSTLIVDVASGTVDASATHSDSTSMAAHMYR